MRYIDREPLHQPIRQTPEQQFIETLFDKQTAIVAQGFLTEIAVRFAAHVESDPISLDTELA